MPHYIDNITQNYEALHAVHLLKAISKQVMLFCGARVALDHYFIGNITLRMAHVPSEQKIYNFSNY